MSTDNINNPVITDTSTGNTSNTERFTHMLRRSSARLRATSVPALDSEQTTNPPLGPDRSPAAEEATPTATSSQRGGNRGRGRRTARGSARPAVENRNQEGGTPSVTLTVPGANANGSATPGAPSASNLQPGSGLSAISQVGLGTTQGSNRTSVIHPAASNSTGLIAEENVGGNATVNKSPPRRNTTSAVVSPPKGMHSWLIANGLSLTNASGSVTPNGFTTGLGCLPKTLANPTSKQAPCFDLTKDTDNDATPSSKETDTSKSTAKSKPEVSTKGIENTGLVSLSKHWHDKLSPLVGYVPLSIFNINWLKLDLLRTTSRPRTSKDKDDKYVGMEVPEEWKMSFGEWVTAFDLFVAYLVHYKHVGLAKRFKVHKENVFAIMRERRSWPMAFRYDMAIRTTVLTIRNSDGKLADPGDRNETIERDARLETERLGDFDPRFADCNPYAEGQVKSHINPISGERMRHNENTFGSTRNDHSMSSTYGKPNARSWAFANQVVYDGPGGVSFNDAEDRGHGSRRNRGRGRGGRWNGGGGFEAPPRGRRGNNDYDERRAEGSGSWKREDRRDDRRGEERGPVGPKFGGQGKAK
ncbi:uncharacterized protein MELLADRAFT_93966 [Melampsora larici-populina 98AG31]|uniref:Uncharacterized protein n=1 Tax=Melampsora larici-populina (strain 98AG31 / pathotype 3-4-7) TaxID=747676 RepID=F4S5X3_MELLP|nr:uncharacterized protein MELLADRAFT_93966 [Melampsora larici-populina 98AG31]EGF99992.1 hypothetical protein MELLADRAFT_93966 [Melampsora larici-populina 98AG31]